MSNEQNEKQVIAVWFSCGAASAVAAKKTIEKYGDTHNIRIVNNPIKEEDSDNRRFLSDVEHWLGVEIETAINPKFPDCSCNTVWEKRKYMAGISGAPCTHSLKMQARQEWEKNNHSDFIVLGFTAEEEKRFERFRLQERSNTIPVLIDEKIFKADCYRIISEAGIQLPNIYRMGYPNANCIGCVKATSPTYWNHVREKHPKVFEERAKLSRELGARLVRCKGKRIFLDELDKDARGYANEEHGNRMWNILRPMSNEQLMDHAIDAISTESAACLVYCFVRKPDGNFGLVKFADGDIQHVKMLAMSVQEDFTKEK